MQLKSAISQFPNASDFYLRIFHKSLRTASIWQSVIWQIPNVNDTVESLVKMADGELNVDNLISRLLEGKILLYCHFCDLTCLHEW